MKRNENKILVARRITAYAFSQTAPRKSGPFGAVQGGHRLLRGEAFVLAALASLREIILGVR